MAPLIDHTAAQTPQQHSYKQELVTLQPQEKASKQDAPQSRIPSAYLYNSFERQTQSLASASLSGTKKENALAHSIDDDPVPIAGLSGSGEHPQSQTSGELAGGRVSPSRGPQTGCDCVNCLSIGDDINWSVWLVDRGKKPLHCRVLNCDFRFEDRNIYSKPGMERKNHERDHFAVKDALACLEHECTFKTNRWAFLLRHYTSVHCKHRQHPCPEIGCDRRGEKAFKRADKLKSHVEEVHRGKKRPRKAISSKKDKCNASKSAASDTKK